MCQNTSRSRIFIQHINRFKTSIPHEFDAFWLVWLHFFSQSGFDKNFMWVIKVQNQFPKFDSSIEIISTIILKKTETIKKMPRENAKRNAERNAERNAKRNCRDNGQVNLLNMPVFQTYALYILYSSPFSIEKKNSIEKKQWHWILCLIYINPFKVTVLYGTTWIVSSLEIQDESTKMINDTRIYFLGMEYFSTEIIFIHLLSRLAFHKMEKNCNNIIEKNLSLPWMG